MLERFCGHAEGLVVEQPRSGVFTETPMTLAQLAAQRPAMKIQDDIFKHANYAGVCYYPIWQLIAEACQAAIDADRLSRPQENMEIST